MDQNLTARGSFENALADVPVREVTVAVRNVRAKLGDLGTKEGISDTEILTLILRAGQNALLRTEGPGLQDAFKGLKTDPSCAMF